MRARRLLLLLGGLALLTGLWAGLLRLGWALPGPAPLSAQHGPLMVIAFLSTVIGLERAVALGRGWGFLGPALAGASGLALLVGADSRVASGLALLSSLLLVIVVARLALRQPGWAGLLPVGGAALLLAANGLWLASQSPAVAAAWWAGFVVLTILAERLELGLLLEHRLPTRLALLASGLLVLGLLLELGDAVLGQRLLGLALLAVTAWGLGFDPARRAIRRGGQGRFAAVCLLLGYAWLAIAGAVWLLADAPTRAGPLYDAALHAVFVGFAFSMIFGHAPSIVPAVAGLPLPYHPRLYAPLALLHGGLLLRVIGDLAAEPDARRWGGLLNALAIVLFVPAARFARGVGSRK
jgi:hypothetical protein